MEIKYKPGQANGNADALSRRGPIGWLSGMCLAEAPLPMLKVLAIQNGDGTFVMPEAKRMAKLQMEDPWCRRLKKRMQKGESTGELCRYVLVDGVIHREVQHRANPRLPRQPLLQMCVPETLRWGVMSSIHDGKPMAHVGARKTLAILSRRYYWPGVRKSLLQFVRSCPECQRAKARRSLRAGRLHPKRFYAPGDLVSIDIVGPFPRSKEGYTYILTMVDCFSRWPELVPLRNITAKAVVDALWSNWIKNHGCPLRVLTDRGSQFESEMFELLCERLAIRQSRTTAYHPQSNAQAERIHRFLKESLIALTGKNHRGWAQELSYVLFAYRTT